MFILPLMIASAPMADIAETDFISYIVCEKFTKADAQLIREKMLREFKLGCASLEKAREYLERFSSIDQVKLRAIFMSSVVSLQANGSPGRCIAFICAALSELAWEYWSDYIGYRNSLESARVCFDQAEFYREILLSKGYNEPQFQDISYLLWFENDPL